MPFWDNLPFANGPVPYGIQLIGDLVHQNNVATSRIGPRFIYDYPYGGSIILSDIIGGPGYCAAVYWLPWQTNEITSVSWRTLYQSGCKFFLTSEFSGCRFVIDSYGVAHVAYWQAIGPVSYNSSQARDAKEIMLGPTPYRRRRLSITANTSTIGETNTGSLSYGAYGLQDSRSIVCGYLNPINNRWYFKVFMYRAGSLGGTWFNL